MNLLPEVAPTDGPLHRQNIAILQGCLVSTTIQQLASQCPGIFVVSDVYFAQQSFPLTPLFTVVVDQNSLTLLIVLNGMVNFDKIPACINGWANPNFNSDGSIYPYQTAANLIATGIPGLPAGRSWNEVRIIGHSYGGAVAMWLMAIVPSVGLRTLMRTYTYGAPKPSQGFSWHPDYLRNTRRVFNSNDPVPNLPLSYDDMSNLWVLTGVPTARQWTRWTQPCSGLTQIGTPGLVPAQAPTFGSLPGLIFTLTGWLSGIGAFGNDSHSLNSYAAYVAGIPFAIAPSPAPATVPTPRHTPEPTAVQLRQAQSTAIAAVTQTVSASPNDTVVGIQSGVAIVAGERFYGRKIGRQHVIYYAGEVITYTRTEREQRAMVRRLNLGLSPI